jgi:hypothetical protein
MDWRKVTIYFFSDNYYNSLKLAKKLLTRGKYVCGTIRNHRAGPENLISIKNLVRIRWMFYKEKDTVFNLNDKKLVVILTLKYSFT